MQKNDYIQANSGLQPKSIQNTLDLLEGGATVPFIARYRKEMTNGLDEVEIAFIRDLAKKFDDLLARQKTVLSSIEEQGKLYNELREKIELHFDFKWKNDRN
jgi:uncharacterized protein